MKRLVIIGGGFAGSYIAKRLENSFDVTLIDSKDYFEFTPSILRTIVDPSHMGKIQVLHKHYLKKARVVRGSVSDLNKSYVKVGKEKLNYDYLAICSGSSYSFPIKEENIVHTGRADHLRDYHVKLKNSKHVVIVGGGLVGVELAAEICTNYPDKNITLIHSREKLIERNGQRASDYAEAFLRRHKVNILFEERVVSFKKIVETNKSSKLKADILFACIGIKPNSDFMWKNFSSCLEENGNIKVNSHLNLIDIRNIFAVGDVTNVSEEKTAQNAIEQAKVVIDNINSLKNGKDLREYQSTNRAISISLGKWNGIFIWNNFVFKGIIPGIIKRVIERLEMMNWKI